MRGYRANLEETRMTGDDVMLLLSEVKRVADALDRLNSIIKNSRGE